MTKKVIGIWPSRHRLRSRAWDDLWVSSYFQKGAPRKGEGPCTQLCWKDQLGPEAPVGRGWRQSPLPCPPPSLQSPAEGTCTQVTHASPGPGRGPVPTFGTSPVCPHHSPRDLALHHCPSQGGTR